MTINFYYVRRFLISNANRFFSFVFWRVHVLQQNSLFSLPHNNKNECHKNKFLKKLPFLANLTPVFFFNLHWPHSFSCSMEQTERFWRHEDVIWQNLNLTNCHITPLGHQKSSRFMKLKNDCGADNSQDSIGFTGYRHILD